MASYKTFQNDQELTSKKLDDGRYECLICPHSCKLRDNQRGICQARIGQDGIILEAYGKITHVAIEPIEKKPIYHYKPNLKTLSVGGYGCSMSCGFCVNWMISQTNKFDSSQNLFPIDVCNLAVSKNCKAVCFTYNEPIIYFEYIMDLAEECKKNGLDLILKTNGYAKMPIWKKLCKVASAINIDWKGNKEQYSNFGIPDSELIKDCIKYAIDKVHVEISVPVYYNSGLSEHKDFANFMNSYTFVPIHLLKIYPSYKDIGCQVTSEALVYKIKSLYDSFKYVYVHNIYRETGTGLQDTFCHVCGKLAASRSSLITKVYKEFCCDYTIIHS